MIFRLPVLKKLIPLTILLTVASAGLHAEIQDPDRAAGDEAAAAGDYLLASRFYGRHLARIKDKVSPEKEKDAYEKYIGSLIRCGEYDRADELYADYFLRCGGTDPLTVSLLKAEILTGRKQYSEALPLLKRVLSGLVPEDPRRREALSAFAHVCEGMGAWNEAASAYRKLRDELKDPLLRMEAHEHVLYCMASSDKPVDTLAETAKLPEYMTQRPGMARLFTLYALLRSGKSIEELQTSWNEAVRETENVKNSPMRYTLWSSMGDLLAEEKKTIPAAEAYRHAFESAPGRKQALETLRRLIAVYESEGDLNKAAGPALMTYQLFEDDFVPVSQKFKVARLLRKAGKFKESAEVYENIISPRRSGNTIRTAAAEYAFLCSEWGKQDKAQELVETYFTGEKVSEGEYLKAEMLFRRKEYHKAIDAFQQVADRFPAWRDKAIHQKILARLASNGEKKALEEAVKLEKTATDPTIRVKAVYLQAQALENMGRFSEAGERYVRYAADDNADPVLEVEALFKSGRFALKSDKAAESRKYFQTILQKYPRSAHAPLAGAWLVCAFRMEGDNVAAESAAWKLARKYPGTPGAVEALFDLAAYELESGKVRKVRQILQSLLSNASGTEVSRRASVMLAASYAFTQDYQNARTVMDQLFEKDKEASEHPKTLYLYADILKGSGDCKNAILWYEKAEKASKDDPVTAVAARGSRGDAFFTLAESSEHPAELYARAAKCFEETSKQTVLPDTVRVMTLYKLGRAREMLGQDDKARIAYREAVYLAFPGCPDVLTTFAAKSAEGLCGIAARRPLRSHIEDAARALRRLVYLKILDRASAEKRIAALRKIQRSKHHF